jgi:hypothetical protein
MLFRSVKFWVLVIGVAAGAANYAHNRSAEKRLLQASPIAAVPQQGGTSQKSFEQSGYRIQPVASYEIRAMVLSIESYRLGREADLSPLDFALGWGPMSDPAVLQELQISQGNRWYQYRWKGNPPLEPVLIVKHSANTHLIPANDDVRRALAKVQKGEVVRLVGSLVNVEHPDGWRWRSSTSRDDTGGGSCELLWVTEVTIE